MSDDLRSALRRLVEMYDEDDGFCCSQHVRQAMVVARAVLAEPVEVETRTETRVTADTGPDYPPYKFVTDVPEKLVALLAENSAFRRNVTDLRIETREVSTTPWVEVPGPAVQEGSESDVRD